jgi:hypothetical protein
VIIIALIGGFFYYQNVTKEEKAVDGTFVEKILDVGVIHSVLGGWKNYEFRW